MVFLVGKQLTIKLAVSCLYLGISGISEFCNNLVKTHQLAVFSQTDVFEAG